MLPVVVGDLGVRRLELDLGQDLEHLFQEADPDEALAQQRHLRRPVQLLGLGLAAGDVAGHVFAQEVVAPLLGIRPADQPVELGEAELAREIGDGQATALGQPDQHVRAVVEPLLHGLVGRTVVERGQQRRIDRHAPRALEALEVRLHRVPPLLLGVRGALGHGQGDGVQQGLHALRMDDLGGRVADRELLVQPDPVAFLDEQLVLRQPAQDRGRIPELRLDVLGIARVHQRQLDLQVVGRHGVGTDDRQRHRRALGGEGRAGGRARDRGQQAAREGPGAKGSHEVCSSRTG